MTAPRPTCVHCGRQYGMRAVRMTPVVWPHGEPMPTYRGNMIVVKEYRHSQGPQSGEGSTMGVPFKPGDMVAYRYLWDGERWDGGNAPFCTLRCADSFARKALKAGWRP